MSGRWAWIDVDTTAITDNVARLRELTAPAAVMAVVKADGYGHGAVEVTRAALAGGATAVAVATLDEGVALRDAGLAAPIMVLSEQPHDELRRLVGASLTPVAYRPETIAVLGEIGRDRGVDVDVHLKVDTGMQRVGAPPDAIRSLLDLAAATAGVRVVGLFTHLACADEPDRDATAEQLARFETVLAGLGPAERAGLVVHAANSAGALAFPAARYDLVRPGVSIYGISPGPALDAAMSAFRPALALRARVGFVKDVPAGSSISYGHRHTFTSDRRVATLPLGYADGLRRSLTGADVLIAGRRHPIVGVITMDQLMVDVGPAGDESVAVGDVVTLIGRDGDDEIRLEDWASRLGTIAYELATSLAGRLPRRYR